MSAIIPPEAYPATSQTTNNEFWESRFGNWLSKFLNADREYSLKKIGDVFHPVLSLVPGYETDILRGEHSYGVGATVPAVVGQSGFAILSVKAGDASENTVAMVDEIIISSAVATIVSVIVGTGPNGNAHGVILPRDLRNRLASGLPLFPSNLQTYQGDLGADPPNQLFVMQEFAIGAGIPFVYRPNHVLLTTPDDSAQYIGVQNNTVNQAFQVSFNWRERQMTQRERSVR